MELNFFNKSGDEAAEESKTCIDPIACTDKERGNLVLCPGCSHLVALGYPHPDFNSKELPVSLLELERASLDTSHDINPAW